jgi:hypothetical protein
MAAKEAIFTAQDALSDAWQDHAEGRGDVLKPDLRALEKALRDLRSGLEKLDNKASSALYRAAQRRGEDPYDQPVTRRRVLGKETQR